MGKEPLLSKVIIVLLKTASLLQEYKSRKWFSETRSEWWDSEEAKLYKCTFRITFLLWVKMPTASSRQKAWLVKVWWWNLNCMQSPGSLKESEFSSLYGLALWWFLFFWKEVKSFILTYSLNNGEIFWYLNFSNHYCSLQSYSTLELGSILET